MGLENLKKEIDSTISRAEVRKLDTFLDGIKSDSEMLQNFIDFVSEFLDDPASDIDARNDARRDKIKTLLNSIITKAQNHISGNEKQRLEPLNRFLSVDLNNPAELAIMGTELVVQDEIAFDLFCDELRDNPSLIDKKDGIYYLLLYNYTGSIINDLATPDQVAFLVGTGKDINSSDPALDQRWIDGEDNLIRIDRPSGTGEYMFFGPDDAADGAHAEGLGYLVTSGKTQFKDYYLNVTKLMDHEKFGGSMGLSELVQSDPQFSLEDYVIFLEDLHNSSPDRYDEYSKSFLEGLVAKSDVSQVVGFMKLLSEEGNNNYWLLGTEKDSILSNWNVLSTYCTDNKSNIDTETPEGKLYGELWSEAAKVSRLLKLDFDVGGLANNFAKYIENNKGMAAMVYDVFRNLFGQQGGELFQSIAQLLGLGNPDELIAGFSLDGEQQASLNIVLTDYESQLAIDKTSSYGIFGDFLDKSTPQSSLFNIDFLKSSMVDQIHLFDTGIVARVLPGILKLPEFSNLRRSSFLDQRNQIIDNRSDNFDTEDQKMAFLDAIFAKGGIIGPIKKYINRRDGDNKENTYKLVNGREMAALIVSSCMNPLVPVYAADNGGINAYFSGLNPLVNTGSERQQGIDVGGQIAYGNFDSVEGFEGVLSFSEGSDGSNILRVDGQNDKTITLGEDASLSDDILYVFSEDGYDIYNIEAAVDPSSNIPFSIEKTDPIAFDVDTDIPFSDLYGNSQRVSYQDLLERSSGFYGLTFDYILEGSSAGVKPDNFDDHIDQIQNVLLPEYLMSQPNSSSDFSSFIDPNTGGFLDEIEVGLSVDDTDSDNPVKKFVVSGDNLDQNIEVSFDTVKLVDKETS